VLIKHELELDLDLDPCDLIYNSTNTIKIPSSGFN